MIGCNKKSLAKLHERVHALTLSVQRTEKALIEMNLRLRRAGVFLREKTENQERPEPRSESSVHEWMPIIERLCELLLVAYGQPELAQAFGIHARQAEINERKPSSPPPTAGNDDGWNDGITYT